MEKTTKKRKKSKRLKKRIGLVVIGGLSLVLTVCLSVGATLAWFAGSTWASNDMYMGGPVYVEMAGRGHSDTGAGDSDSAVWKGGAGTLDIVASKRTTGTVQTPDNPYDVNYDSILLPGQKLLIYSQARVYSTLERNTYLDGAYDDESSGADNSNITDSSNKFYSGTGRVQTTTSSVLRAKFSINVEFDPSVGFNNFTDPVYAENYPQQTVDYTGSIGTKTSGASASEYEFDSSDSGSKDGYTVETVKHLYWEGALGALEYDKLANEGRRDAVATNAAASGEFVGSATLGDPTTTTQENLLKLKAGTATSIYKWRYVSESIYDKVTDSTGNEELKAMYTAMEAPFDGTINTAGTSSAAAGGSGNGFFGVWVKDDDGNYVESDAFYKARKNSYLSSYVENYVNEYNDNLMLQIGDSLTSLEDALNESFVKLVNQSSDNIIAGNVDGFTADDLGSVIQNPETTATAQGASWLYVAPKIGQDVNAGDSSTSVGGWWYLVACDTSTVTSGNNKVLTEVDNVADVTTFDSDTGKTTYVYGAQTTSSKNVVSTSTATAAGAAGNASFCRKPELGVKHDTTADSYDKTTTRYDSDDEQILNAKLYEVKPNMGQEIVGTTADGTTVTKVVSVSFPFVNGNFELPGKELTNIFANAKITFQISFQAIQAFFPFSDSIDSCGSGTALAGTAKALNINNAIPIFNEAFGYLSYLDVE